MMNDVVSHVKHMYGSYDKAKESIGKIQSTKGITNVQRLIMHLDKLNMEVAYTTELRLSDLTNNKNTIQLDAMAVCLDVCHIICLDSSVDVIFSMSTGDMTDFMKKYQDILKLLKDLFVETCKLDLQIRSERMYIFSKIDEATRLIQELLKSIGISLRESMYYMEPIIKEFYDRRAELSKQKKEKKAKVKASKVERLCKAKVVL